MLLRILVQNFRIKWEYTPTGNEMSGYFGSAANGDIYVIDNDTVKLLKCY